MKEEKLFDKLKEHVKKGLEWKGRYYGSIFDNRALSELEVALEKSGLVEYNYEWSFEHENYGPPWVYEVTKKGVELYEKLREEGR